MRINAIIIEGEKGDLEVTRTSTGAHVTQDHEVIVEFQHNESRESRFEKACVVAGYVYGTRKGQPDATNSMIHDVFNEIERVAGC